MGPLARAGAQLLACVALAALAGLAQAQAPVASINTNKTSLQGTVQLTVRAFQSPGAPPDFSPLQRDFNILSRGQTISHQWINGIRRYENLWSMTLAPKRSGTLQIPPLEIAGQRTQAIAVHVTGGPTPTSLDEKPVQMNVLVDKTDIYVQAQSLVTAHIRTRVQLYNASLRTPSLDDAVMVTTANRQYLSEEKGVKYLNFERVFAIFPQSSGTMEVPSLLFTGNMPRQIRLGGSLLRPGQGIRLTSPPITLNVKPRPAASTGPAWLPARSLKIVEAWEPRNGQLAIGVPLTRRLKLVAEGALGSQLPPISVELPPANAVKAYPDPATSHDDLTNRGVRGRREESVALVSIDGQSARLPAIRIPWWNTETDREEILEWPAKTIGVTQGPASVKVADDDAASAGAPADAQDAPAFARPLAPWTLSLAAALVTMALVALGWARRYGMLERWLGGTEPARSERHAWRQLQRALRAGELAAIRRAMLAWQSLGWPDGASDQAASALAHILSLLDRQLYAADTPGGRDAWPAVAVRESLRGLRQSALASRPPSRRHALPGLYDKDLARRPQAG